MRSSRCTLVIRKKKASSGKTSFSLVCSQDQKMKDREWGKRERKREREKGKKGRKKKKALGKHTNTRK